MRNERAEERLVTTHHIEIVHVPSVVAALAADVLLEAVDAVMCAAMEDATIRIGDESPLVQFVSVIVVEMVDDTVTEVGCKHFAFFRFGDNKAGTRTGAIGSLPQFVREYLQVALEFFLESDYVMSAAFVPFGILVSLEDIGGELRIRKMIHSSVLRTCTSRTENPLLRLLLF